MGGGLRDRLSCVEVQMELDAFLRFVRERVEFHGGANIMVLLECHDGPFETLCSVPSGVWQRGMVEVGRDILLERGRPTGHHQHVVRLDGEDGGKVN